MDVIPALDVLDGSAVRLLRGDYEAVTVYSNDPEAVLRGWRHEGASFVHIVDLDAARGRGISVIPLLERVGGIGLSCQVGGGIRNPDDARHVIAAGAQRVVVGSAFVDADGDGEGIADAIGPSRVVAAVDVRSDKAMGHGWGGAGIPYEEVVRRAAACGGTRFLVTGVAVDGTMDGPDLALLASVADIAPGLTIIASGGVGTLDDLSALQELGVESVVVGRALYEHRFTLVEAIAAAR